MPRSHFFRRWLLIVTVGELAGFVIPATVGALTVESPWQYGAVVAAGAVEGALLGAAQWWVLRHPLPRLSVRRWVLATTAGAVVAYAVGMLPSTAYGVWSAWPTPLVIVVAVVVGATLVGSIGFAQWIELRHHVARAGWWIPGTALAWCVALGVFFAVAPPLWIEGQPLALTIAIGVFAGLLMALTMSAVTGFVAARLLRGVGQEDLDRAS